MKLSREAWSGLAVTTASLFLFWLTLDLKANPLVPIGPGFYPRVVLGISAALGIALIVFEILAKKRTEAKAANYRMVALIFAVFGIYVGLIPGLGFRIATLLFMLALQPMIERPRDKKGWIVVLIVAFVTTTVTYYLFEHYLQVLLPRGRWTDF